MDNEKAIEKLRAAVDNNLTIDPTSDLGHMIMNISIAGLLAAIQADPLAYVKPKPLVWEDAGWNHDVYARMSFGLYEITKKVGGIELAFGGERIRLYRTYEAAQAAAEAHRNEMLAKEFI